MSSTTPVPGIAAQTSVITTTCRENRGDVEAIEEALKRIRVAMLDTIPRWPEEKGATFFVCFTVDRDGRETL